MEIMLNMFTVHQMIFLIIFQTKKIDKTEYLDLCGKREKEKWVLQQHIENQKDQSQIIALLLNLKRVNHQNFLL